MDRFDAQRAIATLHGLRFFGLVFLVPGVVGPNLPDGFAAFAAYAIPIICVPVLMITHVAALYRLARPQPKAIRVLAGAAAAA
jgi:hypothetical protein